MFSEQDVDRDLKAAMSVSPSGDFEARVLQRVEQDRPIRTGLFGVGQFGADRFTVGGGLKIPALFAAAASIIIVAGLFYALNRTPVVVAPPATPPIVAHAVPPASKTSPVTPDYKKIDRPRIQTVHASRRAPRAAQPEVLVPVNQMEAVWRLVRAVNEGRIAAPTEPVEVVKAVASEVTVAPLVVNSIPVPALEPDADAPSPIIRGHK